MSPGTWWGRRGAQKHPRHTGRVRIEREPGTEEDLEGIVGTRDEVAADIVRVVGLEVRGAADSEADDALAQPGREPFDLVDDHIGCVAGEAARHVRVRPDRMQVSFRSRGISDVLLSHEDERPGRHATAVNLAFGGGDLFECAAAMDRPGTRARFITPRNTTLHHEVDLERRGTVAPTAVRAPHARQACGRR